MTPIDYGFVFIKFGKHKGRPAYYDDDSGDGKLIVYFGAPCASEYARVSQSCVEQISSAEAIRLGWRAEVQLAQVV